MPAITITAVDTVNDKLTAIAHGLTTGDRTRVRNVGGALPTGLSPATDYFAIRVDADNVKLATSNANALAGTPVVDITGAGSGTNTIEYGLPYCIPTALAAPGSQVKSVDSNAVWNALVALYSFLVGITQSVLSGITLAPNQHVTISGTGLYKRGSRVRHIAGCAGILTQGNYAVTHSSGDNALFAAINDTFRYSITFEQGEQLNAIDCYVKCGATDVLTMKVWKTTQTVGSALNSLQTQLGSTQTTSGHANSCEKLTVSGLTENVGSTAVQYSVELTCTAFATAPIASNIDITTIVP